MGDRFGQDKTPGAVKAHTTVPGTWLLTTSEIMIDIDDKSQWGPDHIYRGYLDEHGDLIVDRGMIYPQGSWHDAGGPLMVLKKVQ